MMALFRGFGFFPPYNSTAPVPGPAPWGTALLLSLAQRSSVHFARGLRNRLGQTPPLCWPGRSVAAENPPIRRVDLPATRDPPATEPVLATRDRTGRSLQLRKAGDHSFCSDPKGRSRKERCSSGLNDPARPSAARTVSTPSGSRTGRRPAKHIFKTCYSGSIISSLQPCAFHQRRPGPCHSLLFSRFHQSRAARVAGASPLLARPRRSQAAAPHPRSQAPLCPASVFASPMSLRNGYWSGGCFSVGTCTGRMARNQPPRAHRVRGPPLTASREAERSAATDRQHFHP